MDKLRNLSIKKTIIVYIIISLLASFLLWAATFKAASATQRKLAWKYASKEMNHDLMMPIDLPQERPNVYLMSDGDRFLMELCDFLLTYGVLVYAVPGIVAAVTLFYRNKIRIPLRELTAASQRIRENNLDFHITYQNSDELGRLCADFERMRAELETNNRKMWRMLEEEKSLRATIAHDIRTPLATLRGYQEMLLEFLPQGVLSREKTEEMLREGMEQIHRLNRFVETMWRLSRLEDRTAVREQTSLEQLEKRIQESARTLEAEYGKAMSVVSAGSDRVFRADSGMVLEVAENLMANALRFACGEAKVWIALEGDMLVMEVTDDGNGYPQGFVLPEGGYCPRSPEQQCQRKQERYDRQSKAYQEQSLQDQQQLQDQRQLSGQQNLPGEQHLGIGLIISRICCEKHGGSLAAWNRPEGGAMAKALFQVE